MNFFFRHRIRRRDFHIFTKLFWKIHLKKGGKVKEIVLSNISSKMSSPIQKLCIEAQIHSCRNENLFSQFVKKYRVILYFLLILRVIN